MMGSKTARHDDGRGSTGATHMCGPSRGDERVSLPPLHACVSGDGGGDLTPRVGRDTSRQLALALGPLGTHVVDAAKLWSGDVTGGHFAVTVGPHGELDNTAAFLLYYRNDSSTLCYLSNIEAVADETYEYTNSRGGVRLSRIEEGFRVRGRSRQPSWMPVARATSSRFRRGMHSSPNSISLSVVCLVVKSIPAIEALMRWKPRRGSMSLRSRADTGHGRGLHYPEETCFERGRETRAAVDRTVWPRSATSPAFCRLNYN